MYEFLNAHLETLASRGGGGGDGGEDGGEVGRLSAGVHVYPDFHGNRSPLGDPSLRGMVSGLSLNSGVDDLAVLYLATLQALVVGETKTWFCSCGMA